MACARRRRRTKPSLTCALSAPNLGHDRSRRRRSAGGSRLQNAREVTQLQPARKRLDDRPRAYQPDAARSQPAPALVEFEASAAREPNRFNGLFGAARAAELSGNAAKARTLYARLVALCDHADDERPELRQAKAALAK
jgi:hypothetical protein